MRLMSVETLTRQSATVGLKRILVTLLTCCSNSAWWLLASSILRGPETFHSIINASSDEVAKMLSSNGLNWISVKEPELPEKVLWLNCRPVVSWLIIEKEPPALVSSITAINLELTLATSTSGERETYI